ncbi:MAG: transporter substrate-binding domain-containing protein [Kordiimonadaceae bacterium]|nr:transporter substrate-binding domain-containing protein [Kordiimonadaceae bacterium]
MFSSMAINGLGPYVRWLFKSTVIFIAMLVVSLQTAASQNLTNEELNWIKEHPVVTATNEMDWGPLDFVRSGKPAGFSIDYLNLVASKVGLEIDYISGHSWAALVNLLRSKEIDIAHSLSDSESREEFLNFTNPYLELPIFYFGRIGSEQVNDYEDLLDKKLAIVSGWSVQTTYQNYYPDLTVIEYPTVKAALIALSTGEVDIFSGTLSTTNYIITKNFISGLDVIGKEFLPEITETNQFYLAARNDWPQLISILNKGMAAITEAEFMAISNKWLSEFQAAKELDLTIEGRQWLSRNNLINVAVAPNGYPYEFIDENGKIGGLSGSYLDEISKLLNVKFVWANTENLADGMNKIKSGEADFFLAVTPTIEREKFLTFTQSYKSLVNVIFGRDGGTKFSNLNSLNGYKVAQSKGSAIAELLIHDYPNIEVIEVENMLQALKLLSSGEVDAFINDIPSATNYISTTGLTNVSVVGSTEYVMNDAMGVRSDLPLLVSAMDKALSMISEEKAMEISSQWLLVKANTEQDYELIIDVIMIALFVISMILIWAISLRREVKRREILEDRLRLSRQEAQSANQAKSTFLANMSHEIRTPLNAIIGFSEVMSEGVFGKIRNPRYREYLRDIENSGHHLETVINDILDLSKIEAGKWKLNESDFDLKDCILASMKMIEEQAKNKNIICLLEDVKSEQLIKIFGDESAYKRIIINLLSNSVKFTESGGKISCKINLTQSGALKIIVTDNGIGIPADRLKHVLSPFAQAHEIRNMSEIGTGLGLPIVNQLSKLHGGSFILNSIENVGTTATIFIPEYRIIFSQSPHLISSIA